MSFTDTVHFVCDWDEKRDKKRVGSGRRGRMLRRYCQSLWAHVGNIKLNDQNASMQASGQDMRSICGHDVIITRRYAGKYFIAYLDLKFPYRMSSQTIIVEDTSILYIYSNKISLYSVIRERNQLSNSDSIFLFSVERKKSMFRG